MTNGTRHKTPAAQTERRTFKAHENLVLQVIKRQAGTLSKAVLEGVMNAIDAGARNIAVTVSAEKLLISDDGGGFKSADAIKEVFEVFGQPHELNADGVSTDAKYGTFRIGRGQLFAFGRNVWHTNTFSMVTDIDTWGLSYELKAGCQPVTGCVIEVSLYNTLSLREVQTTVDEIIKFCRYVPQNLLVNGERVSKDPATLKWDINHELAWINKSIAANRWRSDAGLDVYQQGVFVETIPASEFGLEGTVVIKEAVQVNFARNQVIRNCKRWRKIADLLRDTGNKEVARKAKLTKFEARNLLQQFAAGGQDWDVLFKTACLADTNGKLWSLEQLHRAAKSKAAGSLLHATPMGQIQVGFGPAGCRSADMVMQRRKAVVLDEVIFAYFDINGAASMETRAAELLRKLSPAPRDLRATPPLVFVEYKTLLDSENEDYRLLAAQELTLRERDILDAATSGMWSLVRRANQPNRKLCVGVSSTAEGWTDGTSYIALERKWVATLHPGYERDWCKVAMLLAHEICHRSPDSGTHLHTPEFYEDFHELAVRVVPNVARTMYQKYRQMVHRRAGRLPNGLRNQLNAEAETFVQTELLMREGKA